MNNRPPKGRGQNHESEGVSEKPRGKQERSCHKQTETFQHFHCRDLPPGHLPLYPCEGGNPLDPNQECAKHRGENHQKDGHSSPHCTANLNQQVDFDQRNDQEYEKQ